jgi:cyanophycinase
MAEPDLRAIELAGGMEAPICIIPAAAAPDHNHQRAGQNGVRWFKSLGARQVSLLPLIDQASANQDSIVETLKEARLIYLLGGFPEYLGNTLAGSLGWQAILEAFQNGAVIGGSSAGAMVLCQHYYDPYTQNLVEGLNLVPFTCVIPHHNTFGKNWAPKLAGQLPRILWVGIDEQTGMIDDAGAEQWNVYGKGAVTLYTGVEVKVYRPGEMFSLPAI